MTTHDFFENYAGMYKITEYDSNMHCGHMQELMSAVCVKITRDDSNNAKGKFS